MHIRDATHMNPKSVQNIKTQSKPRRVTQQNPVDTYWVWKPHTIMRRVNRNTLLQLCLINKVINHRKERKTRVWLGSKHLQESAVACGRWEPKTGTRSCLKFFLCVCVSVAETFTWSSGSTSAPFFNHETCGLGSPHTVHVKLRVYRRNKYHLLLNKHSHMYSY